MPGPADAGGGSGEQGSSRQGSSRRVSPTALLLAALAGTAASVAPVPAADLPGGVPTSAAAGGALSAAVTGVHVVHPPAGAPYLADGAGRFVLLRGVDDNALVQYPADYREAPTVGRRDVEEMAALGFDFLRLPVSWSRVMPRPGRISHPYLSEIARVVRWAGEAGIGVLVDMHQDNYSAVTDEAHEADGAPAWAVLDHGTPCTTEATTTACALAAFGSFWADDAVDGKPLQSWYLEAAAAVARAAGADRRSSPVVGVELMNEPWPTGGTFEQASLYPFYRRMIASLRRAGVVAPLWFEPSVYRDASNDARAQAAVFSGDPDLVYAVHAYAGVFSAPFSPTASLPTLRASYANAAQEAATFGTPFDVDEFDSAATPAWNGWLAAQLDLQDAYRVGSGFWLWKQRPGHWSNWSVVHLDGTLRSGTLRAQLLSRPHVDAVPGDLLATTATGERLTARVRGPGGTALLWGGTVVSAGGPTTTRHTLDHVTVDGRAVPASCRRVAYRATGVALGGCLLSVWVPPGTHRLVATP